MIQTTNPNACPKNSRRGKVPTQQWKANRRSSIPLKQPLLQNIFAWHFFLDNRVEHFCLTLLWHTLVAKFCGVILWDNFMGYSCQTALPDTLVRPSCGTFGNTLVRHFCGTLLLETLAEYSCKTLLWKSFAGHSSSWTISLGRAILWDTLAWHIWNTPYFFCTKKNHKMLPNTSLYNTFSTNYLRPKSTLYWY